MSIAITGYALRGNLDGVKACLSRGDDVNSVDEFGYTALIVAVIKGYVEIACYLVNEGANVNYWIPHNAPTLFQFSDVSCLYLAAVNRHSTMVRLLLDAGADVNFKNRRGDTPINRAVVSGNLEIITLLLERGADINGGGGVNSPLAVASSLPFPFSGDVVKFLLIKGAEIGHLQYYKDMNMREIIKAEQKRRLYKTAIYTFLLCYKHSRTDPCISYDPTLPLKALPDLPARQIAEEMCYKHMTQLPDLPAQQMRLRSRLRFN